MQHVSLISGTAGIIFRQQCSTETASTTPAIHYTENDMRPFIEWEIWVQMLTVVVVLFVFGLPLLIAWGAVFLKFIANPLKAWVGA